MQAGAVNVGPDREKLWGNRKTVLGLFDLPHRKLDEFVRNGWVRSVKLGGARQAPRLYHIQDITTTLGALARGHQPRRSGRRP